MTPKDRERAMRKWDKALRSLAHLVSDLEALEAAPIPIDEKERWEVEDENTELRMDISRALDEARKIEEGFPECRYWKDRRKQA